MKSDVQILTDARSLISDPASWTKGEYARDSAGKRVPRDSGDAVSFCDLGAIYRCGNAGDDGTYSSGVAARLLWNSVRPISDFDSLTGWQDAPERTHAEVLAAFDRAIELAKEERQP